MLAVTMTLHEAAEYLGTHYMTVYRYVRLGRLPARKVGGMWQVAVQDLDELQEDRQASPAGRRSADWTARLESRLVAGDEAGAWGVVEAALASGSEPSDVHVEMFGPALTSIGKRWESGELSVAQEHLASSLATRLIGRLGPRFAQKGRPKGAVLVTTPAGEQHAIPSLIVSDLLRGAGFDVLDLGADVPPDSIAPALTHLDGLVAACVSSTRSDADRAIRRTLRAISAAVPDAPIFVGGQSVVDADHARSLGADGWAPDGPGAVRLVLDASS